MIFTVDTLLWEIDMLICIAAIVSIYRTVLILLEDPHEIKNKKVILRLSHIAKPKHVESKEALLINQTTRPSTMNDSIIQKSVEAKVSEDENQEIVDHLVISQNKNGTTEIQDQNQSINQSRQEYKPTNNE